MDKGKIMQVDIRGIKCDVCDFKDDTVRLEDYPEWLDEPCPKCGANLLTQADLDSVLRLVRFVNAVNRIPLLGRIFRGKKEKKMTVEMNGTGSMVFVEKEQGR